MSTSPESQLICDARQVIARRFGVGYRLSHVTYVVFGPDGSRQAIRVESQEVVAVERLPADARHGPDFRSVNWFGTVYTFTPTQAAIVQVLWQAWEGGTPDVGGEHLLERSGSDHDRVDALFRSHPAWGAMIVSQVKGSYRLTPPGDPRPALPVAA